MSRLLQLLLCLLASCPLVQSDYLESPAGRHAVGVQEQEQEQEQEDSGDDSEDEVPVEERLDNENEFDGPDYSGSHHIFERGIGIENYFNDYVLEREGSIEELQERLEMGQVVIIPEAFDPEFADAMYAELLTTPFAVDQGIEPEGYSYHIHAASDFSQHSAFLNQTHRIFSSLDTRMFLTEFTDSDCMGHVGIELTHHAPGDYDNPHTSDFGQNKIAFVWMLAKDWRPEWGGAFYWCPETPQHSYVHASYNSLVLFKVSTASTHMTTMVTKHAQSKRFAYTGAWSSNWFPEPEDDLEDLLENNGSLLTRRQFEEIETIVHQKELQEDRQHKVEELLEEEFEERYPRPKFVFEIDANDGGFS